MIAALCCAQVDTLHSGEYIGDEVDEADERRARRAVALSFLSNMYALLTMTAGLSACRNDQCVYPQCCQALHGSSSMQSRLDEE